jgi:hypothetical protein
MSNNTTLCCIWHIWPWKIPIFFIQPSLAMLFTCIQTTWNLVCKKRFFAYNKWRIFQQTFQPCMLDWTLHYLEKLHQIKPFINVQNMGIKPNSYHIQNEMLKINEKTISLILCSPKICPCFPPHKNELLLVKKHIPKL